MKNRNDNFDTLIYDSLKINDTPPLDLVNQIKSAASGTVKYEFKRNNYQMMKGLIAAVLCLVVGVAATAVAANFFGLRDLIVPNENNRVIVEFSNGGVEERHVQLISLQGFAGSPEHDAAVMWQLFLNEYDVDASFAAIGDNWADFWASFPAEYLYYGVVSLEMVAKIDEITEKFGLSLFGSFIDFASVGDFIDTILVGPLFPNNHSVIASGYKFESGTFQFDAHFRGIDFQFRNSRKGVFDNVFLNVGDITEYTEWNYENAFGMPLLLLNSPHKSLIILETDNAFIAVNILSSLSPEALEAFADVIDFTQLRDFELSNVRVSSRPVDFVDDYVSSVTSEEAMELMAGFWRMQWPNPDNATIMILSSDGTWESPGPLETDITIGGNFTISHVDADYFYLRLVTEYTCDHPASVHFELGNVLVDYFYDALNDRLGVWMCGGEGAFIVWFDRED